MIELLILGIYNIFYIGILLCVYFEINFVFGLFISSMMYSENLLLVSNLFVWGKDIDIEMFVFNMFNDLLIVSKF